MQSMEGNETPRVPANGRKTILVVDDDPAILVYVSALLSDGGHSVMTAANGERALELAGEFEGEIHLLLSDFQMQQISGIELATAISLARPAIKVLLMSGFDGGMLVLNEGWHFLAKPFVASQLRSIVTSILFPDKSRFHA
jgi:two-component system cell cycle sensor histidine kinase/response regulator CckA